MTQDAGNIASTLRASTDASDPSVSWKVRCLNCGATLAGPFCAECGQRALPPHPTVRELAGDALSEFSGWDGKFSSTLRLLVRQPGELTRQWLDGRRVHYISPLRLYFTASLVYFLLAAGAPNLRGNGGDTLIAGPVRISNVTITPDRKDSAPRQVEDKTRVAMSTRAPLSPAERDSALAAISAAPRFMRPFFRRAITDPAGMRSAILQGMPRILFALLPIFAVVLALFYRKRHYPEHLYFAVHLHTFIFLALGLSEAAKYTQSVAVAGAIGTLSAVWIVAYSILALRRVYGGSLTSAFVKGVGIFALYAILAIPALVTLVFVIGS